MKLNKLSFFCFLFLWFSQTAISQNCNIKLSGKVLDEHHSDPLSFANIFIKETGLGSFSEVDGSFVLEDICPGEYHLIFSHIGCGQKEIFLALNKDTALEIFLDHHALMLHEIAIEERLEPSSTQTSSIIRENYISSNSDQNLAKLIDRISGVSTITNGSHIAKPVVQGLYGNRLMVMNNGVAQSGQQWGVDHAPEIDPFAANQIQVIKGVSALAYQGSSLGAVVLVNPKKLENEPHLHGGVNYVFESNGLGNGVHLFLEKAKKKTSWRATGTLKKAGDRKTPNYFLRNTGNEEANFSFNAERKMTNSWTSNIYLSSYNTRLGILRGSHLSNLTDLELAFNREEPYFTQTSFSYDIDAPSQRVNHQLVKFKNDFSINSTLKLEVNYAYQNNQRKEFDVRRGGRTEIPALSLGKSFNFLEAKLFGLTFLGFTIKSGIQTNRVSNINNPETGILPLIPDYISYTNGAFLALSKSIRKTDIEFGGRYDWENRKVAAISTTYPREVLRFENNYHNLNLMAGLTQNLAKDLKISYNVGLAERNPEVNELFSNGLHQGVSGIEEGDPNLKKETSLKQSLSLRGSINNTWFFEASPYLQFIDNFIYLQPKNEVRLTIRGAFPLFGYRQTNARLLGMDVSASFQPVHNFKINTQVSFLQGDDLTNGIPLVFMPSNNIFSEIVYQIPFEKLIDIKSIKTLRNIKFNLNHRYVFEQLHYLVGQDFFAPPPAYHLIGLKVSAEKQLSKFGLKGYLRIENMLNTTYRDYLNRQRYFADALGRNIVFGLNISF